MMLLGSLATKFLTHVGHFGDHSHNQRRFAPTLPHFTGIGAPLQRNPHVLGNYVPTGAPDALTGTVFQLMWTQDSDPIPFLSLTTQTSMSSTAMYPTTDGYPRFCANSLGGG